LASSPSQTLSRGIRALEIVAERDTPPTIAELAAELGVHRSIAYRILRTLEDHSLIIRDDSGRIAGAPGLAALARGVQRDLQSSALPELTVLANELEMSAFIVVWDHDDCITLVSVEPRHGHAAVLQRPGSRHPLTQGAPGIAIQSTYTPAEWERVVPGHPYREAAEQARAVGYATSLDEVINGVSSVAAPLRVPGQSPAALAVVYATATRDIEASEVGRQLVAAAAAIERALGG
jgi:DNA-binding IclR family transcriptional regulator